MARPGWGHELPQHTCKNQNWTCNQYNIDGVQLAGSRPMTHDFYQIRCGRFYIEYYGPYLRALVFACVIAEGVAWNAVPGINAVVPWVSNFTLQMSRAIVVVMCFLLKQVPRYLTARGQLHVQCSTFCVSYSYGSLS